jgi:hypothetical protein
MQGYIYVLINESIPNLIKIGRTTKNPQERAAELSSTGVPTKFMVAYCSEFDDCIFAEKQIHENFKNKRRNKDREFFEIDQSIAIDFIQGLDGRILSESEFKTELCVFLYFERVEFKLYRLGITCGNQPFDEIQKNILLRNLYDYYSESLTKYKKPQDHYTAYPDIFDVVYLVDNIRGIVQILEKKLKEIIGEAVKEIGYTSGHELFS